MLLQGFLNHTAVFSGMLMNFSGNFSKSDETFSAVLLRLMLYSLWGLAIQRTLLKGKM